MVVTCAEAERWYLGKNMLEVFSEYRYLGALFATRVSFNLLLLDLVQKAKASAIQIIEFIIKLL